MDWNITTSDRISIPLPHENFENAIPKFEKISNRHILKAASLKAGSNYWKQAGGQFNYNLFGKK